MAKLHELLAVDTQLQGQADTARKDLTKTLKDKRHLFEEKRITFQSNVEGVPAKIEAQSDIQTNVTEELKWIAGIWSKSLDVAYQIDEANTSARADVILDDGTVLLTGVPGTGLLRLEHRAAELQELISAIPTLDPAKGYSLDDARKGGIYIAREVHKNRTRKEQRPIVLYDATDKHPAQTQLISEDVVIGEVLEQEWSGLITPKQKGEMLERVEELRRALKQARQRANDFEVGKATKTVGEKVFGFVFKL